MNKTVGKYFMNIQVEKYRIYNMNELSQTSLKGQGLLLLEQGIARVCSIGEKVL